MLLSKKGNGNYSRNYHPGHFRDSAVPNATRQEHQPILLLRIAEQTALFSLGKVALANMGDPMSPQSMCLSSRFAKRVVTQCMLSFFRNKHLIESSHLGLYRTVARKATEIPPTITLTAGSEIVRRTILPKDASDTRPCLDHQAIPLRVALVRQDV